MEKKCNIIHCTIKENVPENIKVFYDHLYLSTVMLLTFFELLDGYRKLTGFHLNYKDHPASRERKNIF